MQRLHEIIESHCADAVAVCDHDGSEISYGQLSRYAKQLAGVLAEHGVRAGDRVALVAENCALFPVVVFALSRLDAWLTPINARQSESELSATLAHAGARCVVFTCHVSEPASAHADRVVAAVLCELPIGPVIVSEVMATLPEPVAADDQ